MGVPSQPQDREPHWPAALSLIAVSLLSWSLPEPLTAGPGWLLLVIVGVLEVPVLLSDRAAWHRAHRMLGHTLMAVVTAAMLYSVVALIWGLPSHKNTPIELLRVAGALWLSNVLVFAAWYWRLDAGGPHARARHARHVHGAFLFPQMTIDQPHWRPGFVDYLFLAFNTSTAFSPTDTAVLSRWAKGLMMVQASIALATVAVLAARAVNVL